MKRKEKDALRRIVESGYKNATGGNVNEEISKPALFAGIVETLISDFEPIAQSRAACYVRWAIETGIVSTGGADNETITAFNQ